MKFYLLTASFVLSVLFSFAQKQANVWCFGFHAGLDFNSGSPIPINGIQISTNEGCASIADKTTGRLLFYTDGITVYDSTNNIMPNGQGLLGNFSSTQSAICVPMPGSATLYYIFTVDAQAGEASLTGYGGVAYSIVDMTLHGGLGDVSTLNTQLLTPTPEKVTAVRHCNGNDIWIVTHLWNSDAFYAYLLTSSGLQSPVITNAGIVLQDEGSGFAEEAIGYMKFSPDGKKLAVASYVYLNTVQIFDFDNSTGVISNPVTDTDFPNPSGEDGPYGISFSPDNSKLYVGVFGDIDLLSPNYVYQYNVNAGSAAAILASKTAVLTDIEDYVGGIQIGPDGKIYVAKQQDAGGSLYLDVIKNPNNLGAACNYVSNGLYLGGSDTSAYGLPDMIESYLSVADSATLTYTDCNGSHALNFTDNSLNGTINTSWNFGDPSSGTSDTSSVKNPLHAFSSSGTFNVTVYFRTSCQVDSFTKSIAISSGTSASATPVDTSVCAGDMVQLQANTGGTSYQWSPTTNHLSDSTIANPIVFPFATTTYTVTVTSGGCSATATATINVNADPPVPTIRQSHDTLYCTTDTDYISYQWYYNDTLITSANNPYIIYTKSGNYNVAVTNRNGCQISAGINILGIEEISSHNEINLFPNPVQNELTISGSLPAGKMTLSIYDVLGRVIYSSQEMNNSVFKKTMDVSSYSKGVYFIQVQQAEGKWVRKFVKE